MTGVVSGLRLDAASMARGAARDEMMAAGLAVALAREGLPFRKAHALVGSLVAEAQADGSSLSAVAARRLPEASPALAARVASLFDPREAVRTKAARGGTAPDAVRASLRAAREELAR
jgi:argininosuccinate lyase